MPLKQLLQQLLMQMRVAPNGKRCICRPLGLQPLIGLQTGNDSQLSHGNQFLSGLNDRLLKGARGTNGRVSLSKILLLKLIIAA